MNSAFDTYFMGLKNKKIAVLGLGVSNRPLVRLLLEYGCDVVGCDRTPREKLDADWAVSNSIFRRVKRKRTQCHRPDDFL